MTTNDSADWARSLGDFSSMTVMPARRWLRTSAICLLMSGMALTVASAQDSGGNQLAELPDSPGSMIRPRTVEIGQLTAPQLSLQDLSMPQQESQQQPPASETPSPAGTAAAEMRSPAGVAASNPAGAAIAPAKQRRVRVFLIKVGALLGAGAAIGTVGALASASPSKPSGSH